MAKKFDFFLLSRIQTIVFQAFFAETVIALTFGFEPSSRNGVGFTALPDGTLLLFGGFDGSGNLWLFVTSY